MTVSWNDPILIDDQSNTKKALQSSMLVMDWEEHVLGTLIYPGSAKLSRELPRVYVILWLTDIRYRIRNTHSIGHSSAWRR